MSDPLPPKSSIYTKTGDTGLSSLYNGERRSKADLIFEALGDVDELNSALGLAREYCRGHASLAELLSLLEFAQCALLEIGSDIATPNPSTHDEHDADGSEETQEERQERLHALCEKHDRVAFDKAGTRLAALENAIDALDFKLPKLANFILPSGGLASTHLHMARCICRRAERHVIPLVQRQSCSGSVGRFLNRLSDFLFVAGRFSAQACGEPEVIFRSSETVSRSLEKK